MSKIKQAANVGIHALATTFTAATTLASAGFAALATSRMAEIGDYNAAAIPLTAAFISVAYGAMTVPTAKATKKEWNVFVSPSENTPSADA